MKTEKIVHKSDPKKPAFYKLLAKGLIKGLIEAPPFPGVGHTEPELLNV